MNCEEIGELLPDYLQSRLNADRAEVVEKHLAECVTCGEEAALVEEAGIVAGRAAQPGAGIAL